MTNMKRFTNDIPTIDKSVELPKDLSSYPSVGDRYFEKYFTDPGDKKETEGVQCIMVHSNRICMVTLADSHPVIAEKKSIKQINFQVTPKLNRLANEVVGKGKKGAQAVDEDAILCWIECEDDSRYPVRSHVRGKIVEINERLVKQPDLIAQKAMDEGFVALILPKLPDGLQLLKEKLKQQI